MKPSESIKPISYLKAHAAELFKEITEHQMTLIVTQRGEAKVVVQDVRTYERTQESLALLKMLAKSSQSIRAGKFKPAGEAFDDLRERIKTHRQV